MSTRATSLEDAALGCLLGACVGDAVGATLEFGGIPTGVTVEHALTMPGGGVWKVAPGQITDDGELTLCLAQALAHKRTFEIEAVAGRYDKWVKSQPFDMGSTTAASLGCLRQQQVLFGASRAATMTQAAVQHCTSSKANGSLMRAAPLGIWGHRLSDDELAAAAQADSRLSHPNPSCQHAVACYVIAIASLMRGLGEREEAFQRAERWAQAHANAEVQGWLEDANNNVGVPYRPQEGFVKIAFTHASRHLLLGTDYVAAIRETLYGGGDTDTNACIVGGLIGAACGAGAIPDSMKQPVLTCDTRKGAHPRPPFLRAAQIPRLVKDLLN